MADGIDSDDDFKYEDQAIGLCQQAIITLEQHLDGLQMLHHTLLTMRPEYYHSDEPRGRNLNENILRSSATAIAALRTFRETSSILSEKNEILESDFNKVGQLWRSISRHIDGLKTQTNWLVGDFIRWEIDRVTPYTGTITMFSGEVKSQIDEENISEEEGVAMDDVDFYGNLLSQWAAISTLFVLYLPEMMSPFQFFRVADGWYKYFPVIVERILILGCRGSREANSGAYILLWLAKRFCEMGYIGPTLHLARIPPATVNNVDSMTAQQLLSLIQVKEDVFDPYSAKMCSDIVNNEDVRAFSDYRMLQLFEKIMRNVIPFVKQLYIRLRRSTFFFLDMVFPEETLITAAEEMMSSSRILGLQFEHLKELLLFCSKYMKLVPTYEPASGELEVALYKIHEDVVLSVDDQLVRETWRVRNLAVSDAVTNHYNSVNSDIKLETRKFIIKFAERVGSLNISPQQLEQTYTNFKKIMYIYKGMSEELESAIEETNRDLKTLVVLKCTTTALTVLDLFFEVMYNDLLNHGGQPGNLTVVWVIRRLPLYEEMRHELTREVQGLTISGREPNLVIPTPRGPQPYFDRQVINMDTIQIPARETLTREEFRNLFEQKGNNIQEYIDEGMKDEKRKMKDFIFETLEAAEDWQLDSIPPTPPTPPPSSTPPENDD